MYKSVGTTAVCCNCLICHHQEHPGCAAASSWPLSPRAASPPEMHQRARHSSSRPHQMLPQLLQVLLVLKIIVLIMIMGYMVEPTSTSKNARRKMQQFSCTVRARYVALLAICVCGAFDTHFLKTPKTGYSTPPLSGAFFIFIWGWSKFVGRKCRAV